MAKQQDVETDALPSLTPTSPDIPTQHISAQIHQQSAPMHFVPNAAHVAHFDVALVVSKGDEEKGYQIWEEMSSLPLKNYQRPKVCFSDDPYFNPDKIQKADEILKFCTLIFVVLTKNVETGEKLLWHEAIGRTRLAPKDEVDEKKKGCVRPLHTLCEEKRKGVYRTPSGLASIDSIDWYEFEKPWFKKKMVSLFEYFLPYRQWRELQQSGSRIPAVPTQIHRMNLPRQPSNPQMPGAGFYEAFGSMNLNQGPGDQIHETSGSQSMSEDGGASSLQTDDNRGEEDKMTEGFPKEQPQSKTWTQISPDLEKDVGKAHVLASGPAHRPAKCGAPNTAPMKKEGNALQRQQRQMPDPPRSNADGNVEWKSKGPIVINGGFVQIGSHNTMYVQQRINRISPDQENYISFEDSSTSSSELSEDNE